MRIIARKHLTEFGAKHPKAQSAIDHWYDVAKAADWSSMNDVMLTFSKAKAVTSERARFEIGGGDYRLVVAFDFKRRVVYLKFLGTHAEYDRIDVETVGQF